MRSKRILLTGGKGLLGRALQETLKDNEIVVSDIEEMDITDRVNVNAFFSELEPEIVIHCAAYTDVDGSAKNPNLAAKINSTGTLNVALACREFGSEMVHISTNEVFSGKRTTGYEEWMPLDPINAYGRSKAVAELNVQRTLFNFYIVRTAWLYGPGARNFVRAIMERASKSGQLEVVADEIGNPTYSFDLGEAIKTLIGIGKFGIYHLVNERACSRWEFANEIVALADIPNVRTDPILSSDYVRASRPPLYGQLLNRTGRAVGVTLRPWKEALTDYFETFASS